MNELNEWSNMFLSSLLPPLFSEPPNFFREHSQRLYFTHCNKLSDLKLFLNLEKSSNLRQWANHIFNSKYGEKTIYSIIIAHASFSDGILDIIF